METSTCTVGHQSDPQFSSNWRNNYLLLNYRLFSHKLNYNIGKNSINVLCTFQIKKRKKMYPLVMMYRNWGKLGAECLRRYVGILRVIKTFWYLYCIYVVLHIPGEWCWLPGEKLNGYGCLAWGAEPRAGKWR